MKTTQKAQQLQRDVEAARADAEEKDSQITQLEEMLVEYKSLLDELEKENRVPDERPMAPAGTRGEADAHAHQSSVNTTKSSQDSAAMSVGVKGLLRQIEELKQELVAARKAARGAGRQGTGYKDHMPDDDDEVQDTDGSEVRSVRQLEKEVRTWKERAEAVERFRSR